ncbi:sigma factor-like helix-turn-helix DNA-binding protein [Cupriavidus basilensis]
MCEAFLLSQLDGLAYREIAQRLDVTVNVVQKWMSKAFVHCYTAVYE